MSKLSTVQVALSGKTSALAATQEIAGGGLHGDYKDPAYGILITGSGIHPIRFVNDAQAADFAASTGPGGKWPH